MKKTKKFIIRTILFILLLSVSIFMFKYYTWKIEKKSRKICCNETCFNLEIANDNETRQKWLMYRKSLPNNWGMLFIFDKIWTYSFWMKNTLIPLAWIRLDSDLKIVDIILMDPCKTEECSSYKPQSESQYVLEINQWLISEKWILHIWDNCELIHN